MSDTLIILISLISLAIGFVALRLWMAYYYPEIFLRIFRGQTVDEWRENKE